MALSGRSSFTASASNFSCTCNEKGGFLYIADDAHVRLDSVNADMFSITLSYNDGEPFQLIPYNGGAAYVSFYGTLNISASVFQDFTSQGKGGSFFMEELSTLMLQDVQV